MSIVRYVRLHSLSFCCCCLALVSFAAVLFLTRENKDTIILILILPTLLLLAAGMYNWFYERRLTNTLQALIDMPSEMTLDAVRELSDPASERDRLLVDSLKNVQQSAQKEIAALKEQQSDYREYIESWVHEIKTPLCAIDLIINNNPNALPYSAKVQLDRINSLVEQALFYARSTSFEKDFLVRKNQLFAVVKEAVKSRSVQLINSGVNVDIKQLEQSDMSCVCDEKWLIFILGQLIDNSIRYRNLEDNAPALISFKAYSLYKTTPDECVVLEIKDNGIGIDLSDISRVFEKGFSGSNGRNRKKSTGIGLYLVKELCRQMNINVEFLSNKDKGVSVRLIFPNLTKV